MENGKYIMVYTGAANDGVLVATNTAFKNRQYTALLFYFNKKVVLTWSATYSYFDSVASEILKLTFVLFENSK
jgi:hypothetical protein